MVNFPFRSDACHSHTHALCAQALARQSAFVLEVTIGALQAICVASLANSSALLILQWLGLQVTSTVCCTVTEELGHPSMEIVCVQMYWLRFRVEDSSHCCWVIDKIHQISDLRVLCEH